MRKICVLIAIAIAVLIAMHAIAQGPVEPTPTPTAAQVKQEATLEEFGGDHFAFAAEFHAELFEQLTAGKINGATYAAYSHAFWAAFASENRAADFEKLYKAANPAAQRIMQLTALRLRKAKQAAADAAALTAASKAKDLEEK